MPLIVGAGAGTNHAGRAADRYERRPYHVAMRPDLMDILVCPLCKGDLVLTTTREEEGEILEGSLFCAACNETYPIEDGIPNMLPPDLREA